MRLLAEEMDDLRGRIKNAAGDLIDDRRLEREGQVDRAAAHMMGVLDEARGKLDAAVANLDMERARTLTKDVIDEAKAKVDEALETLKSRLHSETTASRPRRAPLGRS